jgi:AP-1 complex subunit beta-1
MVLNLANRAMQPMNSFAIQLNKNSFGLIPATPLQVQPILNPSQTASTSLMLNLNGPTMKMQPLNSLQVAIKNNIDVFYLTVLVPMHMFFVEDGEIDKRLFLNSWKEIPEQNELQYQLNMHGGYSTDDFTNKLKANNIFTIAKRNVEGQDMLYQSIKLSNNIWILAEVKMAPGNQSITVGSTTTLSSCQIQLINYPLPFLKLSLKSKVVDVIAPIKEIYEAILQ